MQRPQRQPGHQRRLAVAPWQRQHRRTTRRIVEHLDQPPLLKVSQADRFSLLWRSYLAYCEARFAERQCTVNQVVFAGPRWRPAEVRK